MNQKQEHKCGWECSSVNVKDIVLIKWIDNDGVEQTREVCPCCVNHLQEEVRDVYDCKNVFWQGYYWDEREHRRIRKSVGQCMCYSPVHGKRSRSLITKMKRKTKEEKLQQRIGELEHFIRVGKPYREIIIQRDEIRDYLCPVCHLKIGEHLICEDKLCCQLICSLNLPSSFRTVKCEKHGGFK